uniref:Uncharacterized protein n=1 Tax=Lactuca sativa TaxID=4236 RepID=A0A9R1VUN3_LACSA|nr:hypothetical protein LSAT_V11C400200500 [Lactuca sativa]
MFEARRFQFEIRGVQLYFVSPCVDLLHEEKGRLNSNLRARLFPNITYATLRLRNIEEYIKSPKYQRLVDEDVVMLIQLVFVLKGLHGRDANTCIPTLVYKLVDNLNNWFINTKVIIIIKIKIASLHGVHIYGPIIRG